jgi:tRNA/rRNA methyltransferase
VNIRVVLVGVEGSVNLGFIARTCVNFGVKELYLVNPKADLEEARRFAAKADYMIDNAVIVDSLEEALKDVDLSVATTAKGVGRGDVLRQSISIGDFTAITRRIRGRLAVIFGRESTGLTREELKHADLLVTIPASQEYPVLNLSQAVAIVLWELWKARRTKVVNVPLRAGRDKINEVITLIKQVSETIMSKDRAERTVEIWRKIIWRALPSEYEARIIEYWIRRIKNRLEEAYRRGNSRNPPAK